MKAMILAAGLGTRLQPLTMDRPKALVPIGNKPVIDLIIGYLKNQGITEIVVNAHHHQEQIVKHLDGGRPFGIRIDIRVEQEILGTGGGIENTRDFWDDDPFIVINGDVLTDINLENAYDAHGRSGSPVTLILHDQPPFNQIRIDSKHNILDIAQENRPGRMAFTGIHIIDPEVLNRIPKGVFSSIIDCYRRLMEKGKPPKAYLSTGHNWRDIGSVQSYVLANREALKGNRSLVAPGCRIHHSAMLKDWAVIDENTILEQGVEVERSILWEKVIIRKGKKVIDSIVTASKEATRDLNNEIL